MLRTQTILQYFYKLQMWQILTSFNMGPSLTFFTYNNYLENTKAKSAVCKNVVK